MLRIFKRVFVCLLIGMWLSMGAAEEISHEQFMRLDNQIQDIKKDVLDISSSLIQLEEKFIYPQDTRVSIFLAIEPRDKSPLDTINIKIDGKEAASHKYTFMELDALQRGGVHRIYTGNIANGGHALEVAVLTDKPTSNKDRQRNADFNFSKKSGTKIIEIYLSDLRGGNQSINFRE